MPVIHICDRCGFRKQYPVAQTKEDPLGQMRGPQGELCFSCAELFVELNEKMERYAAMCRMAFKAGDPVPPHASIDLIFEKKTAA